MGWHLDPQRSGSRSTEQRNSTTPSLGPLWGCNTANEHGGRAGIISEVARMPRREDGQKKPPRAENVAANSSTPITRPALTGNTAGGLPA